MNSESRKSVDVNSMLQDLDDKVNKAKEDCAKVIKQAEDFLRRKKSDDETR